MVLDASRMDSCSHAALQPISHMSENPPKENDFIHSEEFLHGLMKRQLKLSITCATAFLILLFGLPLLNYLVPAFMAQRVGGFTLTWLILGVLFFPYVWIIAKYFISRSMALENAEVRVAAEGNKRNI
jgi:uncharacterized membrane protein (DUF485 family)